MRAYAKKHWLRFVKYSFFGTLAFGLDLGLLYVGTTMALIPYYIAVPVAFLISTSLHYIGVRTFVFHDTSRSVAHGYYLFIVIMCTNALVITLLIAGLIEYAGAPLFAARIGVGAIIGVVSFYMNSRYNFKVL